jgi:hypothetical protein
VHACHAEGIEEGGFTHVGHTDNKDAGAEEGVVVQAMVFGETEDGFDVFF